MAKNKKPRKKYHPKPVRTQCYTKEDVESLQAMIRKVSLATEISLPAGSASREDVQCIASLLNHATMGLLSRDWLDVEERAAAAQIVDHGGDMLVGMVRKACNRADKEQGEEPKFICTAEELNAIRDAVEVADRFVTDSLDETPGRTLREFFAMKTLMCRKNMTPDGTDINKAVGELADVPTWKWREHK